MKLGIISPRVLIRRALTTFLASTGAGLVVMEGSSLSDSLEEVKRSNADMLIVDLCGEELEELSGLGALGLSAKVVVLMDDVDSDSYARAFKLGIWGCLSTRQSPVMFENALKSVANGERWMPDSEANDIAEKESSIEKATEELTPREWEVLGLLANGLRNKEISIRLNICEETAKSHVKSIYRKLKLKGRREAIFRYYDFVHSPAGKETMKHLKPAEGPSTLDPNKI